MWVMRAFRQPNSVPFIHLYSLVEIETGSIKEATM